MRILPEPVAFQWDTGNVAKNFEKHGVTTQEAEEVFANEPFVTAKDVKHSSMEQRFYGLGRAKTNRKLFVAFTVRDKKVRVIPIRDMKKRERLAYEQRSSRTMAYYQQLLRSQHLVSKPDRLPV